MFKVLYSYTVAAFCCVLYMYRYIMLPSISCGTCPCVMCLVVSQWHDS